MHSPATGGRKAARLLVALVLAALLVPLTVASTAAATVDARASVSPTSVAQGSTVSIKVDVKNNSYRSGTGYVYTYVRTSSGQTLAYTRATRSLPRGTWVSVSTSYRVPSSLAAGTYRIDVRVSGVVSYTGTQLATFNVTGGTSSTPAPTPTPSPAPSGGSNLDQMEAEFLTLLNSYRQQNGLPALTRNAKLDTASYNHSLDMATRNYFSHNTPEGKTPWTRMAEAGYTCNGYKGENIAAGYSSAQSVFNAWKSSSGHNKNMLSSSFSEIGIGLAYSSTSKYKYYWTTDFGHCL